MEGVTRADVGHEPTHAVEDIALAARCAATTVLITAQHAAAVVHLARRIHAASDRAAFPLLLVPAATMPIDAAVLRETCAGLLDTARGGSLLLTDVEHLPVTVQGRLIDTIANLQAVRQPTDRVRLIAGTTTSLYERISDGSFCERLFYQLNLIHVVFQNDAAGASATAASADC